MTLTNFTQYELQKTTTFANDFFQSFHTCVVDWHGWLVHVNELVACVIGFLSLATLKVLCEEQQAVKREIFTSPAWISIVLNNSLHLNEFFHSGSAH